MCQKKSSVSAYLQRSRATPPHSAFLSSERFNANQMKFVELIVDYVVKNGYLEKKVLQQDPFRSLGSVSELFRENIDDAKGIIGVIDEINRNSDLPGA